MNKLGGKSRISLILLWIGLALVFSYGIWISKMASLSKRKDKTAMWMTLILPWLLAFPVFYTGLVLTPYLISSINAGEDMIFTGVITVSLIFVSVVSSIIGHFFGNEEE